jgi:prepilin-type N-terminal cleavage/methylation domain-containing protein
MPSAPDDRRGMTLIELLVTLAVMGVLAGTAAFAFRPSALPAVDPLADGRTAAIREGRPRVVISRDTTSLPRRITRVLFLPDGRALGPGRDPLTGLARTDSPPGSR